MHNNYGLKRLNITQNGKLWVNITKWWEMQRKVDSGHPKSKISKAIW